MIYFEKPTKVENYWSGNMNKKCCIGYLLFA